MEENENQNQNYISLAQAAKMCSYSEHYLRLRARQGKLKSIKLGKKWMTTLAWLREYEERVAEWRQLTEAKNGARGGFNFRARGFIGESSRTSAGRDRNKRSVAGQFDRIEVDAAANRNAGA